MLEQVPLRVLLEMPIVRNQRLGSEVFRVMFLPNKVLLEHCQNLPVVSKCLWHTEVDLLHRLNDVVL